MVVGASRQCNGVRRGKPILLRGETGKPALWRCETGQAHVSTKMIPVTSRLCREESCQVGAKYPCTYYSLFPCIDTNDITDLLRCREKSCQVGAKIFVHRLVVSLHRHSRHHTTSYYVVKSRVKSVQKYPCTD
jgi:hypothetical protein